MTKRAWQGTAVRAGKRTMVAGLVMIFGGAAAIVANQRITQEKTGKNEYEIVGMRATAPNEFQAEAMMFSFAGFPVSVLGFLSIGAGLVPLPERKRDKSGPSPK